MAVLEKLQKHAGVFSASRQSAAQAADLMTLMPRPHEGLMTCYRFLLLSGPCTVAAKSHVINAGPRPQGADDKRDFRGKVLKCVGAGVALLAAGGSSILHGSCFHMLLPRICVIVVVPHAIQHTSTLRRLSGFPHAGEEGR